jgi:hypothetical protein
MGRFKSVLGSEFLSFSHEHLLSLVNFKLIIKKTIYTFLTRLQCSLHSFNRRIVNIVGNTTFFTAKSDKPFRLIIVVLGLSSCMKLLFIF